MAVNTSRLAGARRIGAVALCVLATACTTGGTSSTEAAPDTTAAPTVPSTTPPSTMATLPPVTTTTTPPTTTTTSSTTTTTTTTTIPTFTLRGRVTTTDGTPLRGVVVSTGGERDTTGKEGRFRIEGVPAGEVRIRRPAWLSQRLDWDGEPVGAVTLKPRVVRAIRATPEVAGDPDRFADLLALAEATAVNALVFDTKDETGKVRHDTAVKKAVRLGAVDVTYDHVEAVATAREHGLYTITRIVTFEDLTWSAKDEDAKLAGNWVDPLDEENWSYPLALAIEACAAGFHEIQFDYVRFPSGRAATVAAQERPLSSAERVDAIRRFLATASRRLHKDGCAVSAAIFGIVVSSPTDEGIGQRPEEVSQVVDAVSPMVYPSHYGAGWLGFDDPNDHPASVTADALDDALPRLRNGAILRPWLQGFYWTDGQIRAAIDAAEQRGHGWIIWNAAGRYPIGSLPAPPG